MIGSIGGIGVPPNSPIVPGAPPGRVGQLSGTPIAPIEAKEPDELLLELDLVLEARATRLISSISPDQ